jgi:hypothetical protein
MRLKVVIFVTGITLVPGFAVTGFGYFELICRVVETRIFPGFSHPGFIPVRAGKKW